MGNKIAAYYYMVSTEDGLDSYGPFESDLSRENHVATTLNEYGCVSDDIELFFMDIWDGGEMSVSSESLEAFGAPAEWDKLDAERWGEEA
jgi:hypothetical protein